MSARATSRHAERVVKFRASQRFEEMRLSSQGLALLAAATTAEFSFSPFGTGLSERAFVAVVTATAAIVCVSTLANVWLVRRSESS